MGFSKSTTYGTGYLLLWHGSWAPSLERGGFDASLVAVVAALPSSVDDFLSYRRCLCLRVLVLLFYLAILEGNPPGLAADASATLVVHAQYDLALRTGIRIAERNRINTSMRRLRSLQY